MTLTHATNLFEFTWHNSVLFSLVLPFMFGAAFGSFLNVVVLRAKLYDPWSPSYDPSSALATVRGRSYCPTCGKPISFWYNVPAISWFLLRGKSACCNTPISAQYPSVEWVHGLSFLALCHTSIFPMMFIWFALLFSTIGVLLTYLRFGFLPQRLMTIWLVALSILFLFI